MEAQTTTSDGDGRVQMLATLQGQLDELLEAQDRLSGAILGQGYVVTVEGLYLTFDVHAGSVTNPRSALPHRCVRFTRLDALTVARNVRNGNGLTGGILHVRDAVHTEIGRLQELLDLIGAAGA